MQNSYLSQFLSKTRLIRSLFTRFKYHSILGFSSLIFVDLLELSLPLIIAQLIDLISSDILLERSAELKMLLLIYFVIISFQAILRISWRYHLTRLAALSGETLRSQFHQKLLHLPGKFYLNKKSGDLISVSTNDIQSLQLLYDNGMILIGDALIIIIVGCSMMFYLNSQIALLCLLPLLLIPLIVKSKDRIIHSNYQQVQQALANLSAWTKESFSAIKLIKAAIQEQYFIKKFIDYSNRCLHNNLKLARLESRFGPTLELLTVVSLSILFLKGGSEVLLGGMTIGTFVAFYRYIVQLQWPMEAVGLATITYQKGLASSARISEILDQPQRPCGNVELSPPIPAIIKVKDLNFTYNSTATAIKGINLTIPPGSWIGISGPLAGGKSTLLKLLSGQITAPTNSIFYNQIDITSLKQTDLDQALGYLGQDPYIFNDTILNNLNLQNTTFTKEQIVQALALAGIEKDFLTLPLQLQTVLGERGIKISGGQKRRLALARIFLHKPRILFLDDPLGSVDLVNQSIIFNNLQKHFKNCTVIICTSQVSVLKRMQSILILDNGRVSCLGNYADLMKNHNSWFYRQYCEDAHDLEQKL